MKIIYVYDGNYEIHNNFITTKTMKREAKKYKTQLTHIYKIKNKYLENFKNGNYEYLEFVGTTNLARLRSW